MGGCWKLSHTYTNSQPITVSSRRSLSYCSVFILTDCFLFFLLPEQADLPSPDLQPYRSRRMWRKHGSTYSPTLNNYISCSESWIALIFTAFFPSLSLTLCFANLLRNPLYIILPTDALLFATNFSLMSKKSTGELS